MKRQAVFTGIILLQGILDSSISSNSVLCAFLRFPGILWVGTQSGLNRYVASRDRFITYSTKDGLPSNLIMQFWRIGDILSGSVPIFGMPVFSPIVSVFSRYDLADGLQNYEYNLELLFAVAQERFFSEVSQV
jgi:hypothetical protein